MPKLGLTMEEATVTGWLVADGERVTVGQPICEIETDKATQELEAEAEGSSGTPSPSTRPSLPAR